MKKRLLGFLACGVLLIWAQQTGEFARLSEKLTGPAEADPADWLSERQAGEIEDTLADLSRSLIATRGVRPGLIHPQFHGTSLRPIVEEKLHAAGGLEAWRGTPDARESETAASFAAELRTLLSTFKTISWAKFKVTGIEPDGEQAARALLLFQASGAGTNSAREQIRVEWNSEWKKSVAGKWQLTRLSSGPLNRSRSLGPASTARTGIATMADDMGVDFHAELTRVGA
jgi:hypothetical protein